MARARCCAGRQAPSRPVTAWAVLKDAWRQRRTLGDARRSRERAAFLPAILEIQETPPNPLARWLAWSLLALVVLAVLWACFGRVNIVASAEGKIIPSSRVKQIQPLEKGVVKAILVHEGEYVVAGQALIELDTTLSTADTNRLQAERHGSALHLAVKRALLAQIDAAAGPEPSPEPGRDHLALALPAAASRDETRLYRDLLWQQWRQYRAQHQALHSSLRKTRAEQAVSREVIGKLEQILPIVTRRARSLDTLRRQRFAAENEYLLAEQERIQNRQDLAAERARAQQLLAAESEVREQINAHVTGTSGALLVEIADLQQRLAVLDEELVKARDRDTRHRLLAPVAGRVQELAVSTVGGVVTPAQPLMLLVPDEEQLEVEVFLRNKDIGFVREAMPAEIKIHTFPFTRYGVIEARVSTISNDAIVDEQQGLVYSMHLTMAKNTMDVKGRAVKLMPGMAVTAEVKTGKRRVIEFFLTPLLRAKNESIREP